MIRLSFVLVGGSIIIGFCVNLKINTIGKADKRVS
ncbi:hypothetical protein ALQ31_100970 [Pseudomonas amygdali pv. morsprunorum]|nr:hypothetical protein ALQ45_102731 [Pseudomonas amygdali pv. morsprunorum]RMP04248.1 hypothetical protein ALQ31_100970 [Pseudomonas amygdali pv. morsprunorum]RMU26225.1 hypothetical protein ALP31_103368 [Pseudomonas amygdali pv. morsprunorum]